MICILYVHFCLDEKNPKLKGTIDSRLFLSFLVRQDRHERFPKILDAQSKGLHRWFWRGTLSKSPTALLRVEEFCWTFLGRSVCETLLFEVVSLFFFDSLFERLCFERDLVGYLLVSEPEHKRGCPRDLLGGRGGGSLDAARLVVVKPESRLGANGVEEARGPEELKGSQTMANGCQWNTCIHKKSQPTIQNNT